MREMMGSLTDRLRLPAGATRPAGSKRRGPPVVMAGYLRSKDEGNRWRRASRYGFTFFTLVIYCFLILLLPRQVMFAFLLPLMALFGFVIWAMPVTDRAPPKLLDTLFWLYFGSLFLWPNYLALTIPGLPWFTAARILSVPLMLMLLWCASTSAPFKAQMAKARGAMPAMIWLVFAFTALQVFSIGFSDAVFTTINRVASNMLTWTVMFFAAIWVFRDVRKIETWILGYVLMTAALCAMAILESLNGGVLWAQSVPSFLKPPDPLVNEILAGSYRLTGQYRVQATQTTPLSLAEMLSLALPMLFYVVVRYPKPWVYAAALALDAAIIYVLLLTDARLGFVALLLGHMLVLLYYGWQRWTTRGDSLIGPAITLAYPVMAIAAVLAVTLIGRVRVRVLGGGQHEGSNQARSDQWWMGLDRIWESPIFGFGADRGGAKVGYYSPSGQLTIDSYYLSILMDYGFVGFFLFYGMFLYAIIQGLIWLRDINHPHRFMVVTFTVFVFQFLVIKAVLSQSANHPLLFMAFGALVAIAVANREGRPQIVTKR